MRNVIAALALVATAACDSKSAGNAVSDGRVDIGLPVPAYSTLSLAGDSVSLAQQKGKVVLLNIWATWCHPCRDEIPVLISLHERYRPRGMELIGVSVDSEGNQENIRAFMTDFRMNFPVWHDPEDRISNQFLVVGVPATFLIDRNGVLLWRKTGPIAENDTTLTSAIERALGSA